MSVHGHFAGYPPCTTNYTHPHIRAFSNHLLAKYCKLKESLKRAFGLTLECDYCDNFFKEKQDRSQRFLELFNAQGKKKRRRQGINPGINAPKQAKQNAFNMHYQQSNFIVIDVKSHQQSTATTNFGAANNQQSSDKANSNFQRGTVQPGTNQRGSNQSGTHQPGSNQPVTHEPSAGPINVSKSQVTPKSETVTPLSKKEIREIDMMNSRVFDVALYGKQSLQMQPVSIKPKKKKKKKQIVVYYYNKKPGQPQTVVKPIIEERTEHTDLTDVEVKSQSSKQPLPQIKINISNKPSSSKSRTVTVEGKDSSETPLLQREPTQDPSSAVITDEKHTSTYKAPFHLGPTGNTIPRLIGRVLDNQSDAIDTNLLETAQTNVFQITPASSTNQQNVSSSQMRSDPFQRKIFCSIHKMCNCSCRIAPATTPELPKKSEQLKVVIPTNAQTRTVYVSQEPGPSTDADAAKKVCKRKRNPKVEALQMVINNNTLRAKHRAGVPRGQCMVGELDMPYAYQVGQPCEYRARYDESDSDSDCKVIKEDETPDGSELPDLLMSVYQSDMQSDASKLNQDKSHENKNPDTQGPSKRRKTDPEDSRPLQHPDVYVSIHRRAEIICSVDKTVMSLAKCWPWEKKVKELITVTYDGDPKQKKAFKNILQEPDLEYPSWIKIKVTGYPRHWDRHKLLDTLINWRDVSKLPLTPCFIEFAPHECMFLVYNCGKTLDFLYSQGLVLHGDDYRMNLSITQLAITQFHLRFRLKTFLEYRLNTYYDKEAKAMNLSEFLREPDISMMCHFPLNKIYNQKKLMQLNIEWRHLTKLNLANNQLTSLEGFNLPKHLSKLEDLDIGDNWFELTSQLSSCRGAMSVKSVRLEGNPICLNFIQRDEYTDVAKFLFPNIEYLDGVKISGLLESRRNYCPYPEAEPLVERFLEFYFNLLESKCREKLCSMYSVGSMLTLSCQSRLKKLPEYENLEMVRACRDVRLLNEVMDECFIGNEEISERLAAWPPTAHDPHSFTVDVIQYTERSIVLTVTGVLRVLCQPLPEECPLLDFSRTFVMSTRDGEEYVINNDLWYIAVPTPERMAAAFAIQRPKLALKLQLDTAPDEDLKGELIEIFMKLTSLKRTESSRCLEMRNWDIRCALQYFIQLLEVNEVSTLSDVR